MTSIPVISFASFVELSRVPNFKNKECENLIVNFVEIRSPESPAENCYGVRIEDVSMSPCLEPGMIGVFTPTASGVSAVREIFALGLKNKSSVIRHVAKNESQPGEMDVRDKRDNSTASTKTRVRKSFMTPTPLHIPGSRVSPIPESAHQSLFLKRFDRPGTLAVVPVGNVMWMHPLISILDAEGF